MTFDQFLVECVLQLLEKPQATQVLMFDVFLVFFALCEAQPITRR